MLDQVTPVILTLNEEDNLGRTLAALRWAQHIVVVDAGSKDATRSIATSFPNVELFDRSFDSHAEQWNFAISRATTEWVLALDADYLVPPEFIDEIAHLRPEETLSAYRTSFIYVIHGRSLRGSLYPAKPVLFRRHRARYIQDGHTQQLIVEGRIEDLRHHLVHDDRKSFDRWLESQLRYARLEANKLLKSDKNTLSPADRLRKAMFAAPFLAPLYTLFVRSTILYGWPGVYYAFQRAIAEILLSLCLIRARLSQTRTD